MGTMRRWARALELVRLRELAIAAEACPLCGFPLVVRLRTADIGVRCMRCGASAIAQSLVAVLRDLPVELARCSVHELSSSGPVVDYLRMHAGRITTSEFLEDVARGSARDGVRCENVEALTFSDRSFDLCTSTEVFEHVENDRAGFAEVLRVLRPGGYIVFTVPLLSSANTVERTAIVDGVRVQTLPPEYHADRFRGSTVFCYRNYGHDIVERLSTAGFADPRLVRPDLQLFGFARSVVIARRAGQR